MTRQNILWTSGSSTTRTQGRGAGQHGSRRGRPSKGLNSSNEHAHVHRLDEILEKLVQAFCVGRNHGGCDGTLGCSTPHCVEILTSVMESPMSTSFVLDPISFALACQPLGKPSVGVSTVTPLSQAKHRETVARMSTTQFSPATSNVY